MSRQNNPSPAPVPDGADTATWPERVIALAHQWQADQSPAAREPILSELWLLLNAAILKYLRIHGRRYTSASHEDIQDLASDKTLDLLRRLDHQQWDPTQAGPGQLCSFISTLARNGLIDHLRVVGSKRAQEMETADREAVSPTVMKPREEAPEAGFQRERFAEAVGDCAGLLNERTRKIWFMRVLLDMPSKEIAHHPGVNMKPSAVDMALSRCRGLIRDCMQEKGFEAEDMPPGVFTTLWETFRGEIEGGNGL